MTEQELRALAAKEDISVEELRTLLKKGKAQTSSLKERLAKQEAFMGRSMKSDGKHKTVNKTAESAAAFNERQSDFNDWQRLRGLEREEDRKSKEKELVNKMGSHIRLATDKVARVAAPVMMTAATVGAAPMLSTAANSVYNGLNYANRGWQLWNATHPVGSMVANAAFTGMSLGLLAGDNGVAKTQNALNEGRYGDAILSGMGDLWNGAVATQGLYNFGNLLGSLVSQIPNLTDIAHIPGDAVIFDPMHPIGVPYAAKPYGIPEMLPESTVPGAATVTRPTSYTPPRRTSGLHGGDGLFLWRTTTLPASVSTNSQPIKGGFNTSALKSVAVPVGLPYGSTLPPVIGMPLSSDPLTRTPMIDVYPGWMQGTVAAPSYYSSEVHNPEFESWWRLNYQPGDTGYWNGKPIVFKLSPQVWRNDSDGSLISPNYRGDDSGDYRYYNEHNGNIVPEDTSNWEYNSKKAKLVKAKAEASGETRVRHK